MVKRVAKPELTSEQVIREALKPHCRKDMIEADRIISVQAKADEEVIDRAIRPKLLADYVGQPQVREQMDIFIKAAKLRQDALDHLLIFGPLVWEKQPLLILWQMKWA